MEGFKKKGLDHFRLLAGLLIILILTPQSFAATVGHGAPAIGAGMFESGEGRITLSGIGRVMLNE